MTEKSLPFTKKDIDRIRKDHPTPFHIYDETAIRANARRLLKAFEWADKEAGGFEEFFAVKALPNPVVLSILKEEGLGTDCSSLPELILSERSGITGEQVMFSCVYLHHPYGIS